MCPVERGEEIKRKKGRIKGRGREKEEKRVEEKREIHVHVLYMYTLNQSNLFPEPV